MKLFEITCGYVSKSHERMLVIAESSEEALAIARPIFEERSSDRYPIVYFKYLKAKTLCNNTSKEWHTKILGV